MRPWLGQHAPVSSASSASATRTSLRAGGRTGCSHAQVIARTLTPAPSLGLLLAVARRQGRAQIRRRRRGRREWCCAWCVALGRVAGPAQASGGGAAAGAGGQEVIVPLE